MDGEAEFIYKGVKFFDACHESGIRSVTTVDIPNEGDLGFYQCYGGVEYKTREEAAEHILKMHKTWAGEYRVGRANAEPRSS